MRFSLIKWPGVATGSGGGTVLAAVNGVSLLSPTTVQLGGTMTEPDTTIIMAQNDLEFLSDAGFDATVGIYGSGSVNGKTLRFIIDTGLSNLSTESVFNVVPDSVNFSNTSLAGSSSLDANSGLLDIHSSIATRILTGKLLIGVGTADSTTAITQSYGPISIQNEHSIFVNTLGTDVSGNQLQIKSGVGLTPMLTIQNSNNTFLGNNAGGGAAPSVGVSCTGIGFRAMISIQAGALNLTGVGINALRNATTARQVTVMGANSGFGITTGSGSVFFGDSAMFNVTTQNFNTILGFNAFVSEGLSGNNLGAVGELNTAVGYNAGGSGYTFAGVTTTINSSIFLGYSNGVFTEGITLTNTMLLGNNILTDVSNIVMIGRTDQNVLIGAPNNTADSGDRLQVHGSVQVTSLPTSPNAIKIVAWDTVTNQLVQSSGIIGVVDTTLFTQIAQTTVANTTAETTLIGTGVGSLTLPVGYLNKLGKSIRIRVRGFHSAVSSPHITIKVYIGSTVVLTTGVVSSGNSTNAYMEINADISVASLGISGTVLAQGYYQEAGLGGNQFPMINTVPVTLNTTIAQTLNVTAQWDAANPSNSITSSIITIQAFN